MPHFAGVEPGCRLNVVASVKATLQDKFASKGLVHEDVAWHNIGLYSDGAERRAVVFDLGRVRDQTIGEDNWVDDAIAKLQREA